MTNAGQIFGGGTHAAVALDVGGVVSNALTGTIANATGVGVYATVASASVFNAGLISVSGTRGATDLLQGGYLTNATTGTIKSSLGVGVAVEKGAGTVVNAGLISGATNGIYMTGGADTLSNAGLIVNAAGTHSAVVLYDGGYVGNAPNGTIRASGADGILMKFAAGTVVNAGLISGVNNGLYMSGGADTLSNAGRIITSVGTKGAVDLFSGGYVGNATNGTIQAFNGLGVYIGHGTGTVVNAGLISAGTTSGSDGVSLGDGGTVCNTGRGIIKSGNNGNHPGVYIGGAAGTVDNAGLISGGTGVDLFNGGYVSNALTGTIGGTAGSALFMPSGAGAVYNAGQISGNINLVDGGVVRNAATGTISATATSGVYIKGGTGTLVNAGQSRRRRAFRRILSGATGVANESAMRCLLAHHGIEAGAAANDAEGRAVLWRHTIEPVGEPQAAGALHVLDHHVGLPGMWRPMWRASTRA